MNSPPAKSTSRLPRWHWLYYVLAAFDIVAVCFSLFMNHRMMEMYEATVSTNRRWTEILQLAGQLADLAATLDAPGNDVFETHRAEPERKRLANAEREFYSCLSELKASLAVQPESETMESLRLDLATAQTAALQIVRDATLTLDYYAANQQEKATQHMAVMDQHFSTINSLVSRFRTRVGSIQDQHFIEQTELAGTLHRFEYTIAAMVTLMILGVTLYGRTLARHAHAISKREREYRDELELRVAERTSALVAANAARADLLRQLITAQEDERRRIARDLHDGIGQALTYLLTSLRRLEAEPVGPTQPERFAKLREVTAQTLEDVRRLARGLRPSILDDLGLQPALERLVGDAAESGTLSISFADLSNGCGRLPEIYETALYRIAQESLSNIAKHAQATKVSVVLAATRAEATLMVQDNGRGFRLADGALDSKHARSVGLGSIRERAAILGGVAEIQSQPGRGTTICVRLPLAAEA